MLKYTQLKSSNRKVLADVIPLAKPFTLLIEPTGLCNFKCIHCFQSIKKDNYFSQTRMTMPLERFKKIIEQLKNWPGEKLKVLKLSLYGEPLLNRDFTEMLRLAKEADIADRIETTSNVSLLTREVAEKMVDYQLDYLRVSIYGTEQTQHEHVTGSKINIKQIHENLKVLQEIKRRKGSQKPFVAPKMLDSFDEGNQRFIEMYSDVADEVFIDKPHSWIKVDGKEFIEDHYCDKIDIVKDDFKRNSTKRVACPMPFTTMTVRSNGDVAPCCVDFIGGTNLGNMEINSLQEIWNSSEWLEFQKMQLQGRRAENPSCANCDSVLSDHYTRDNIDNVPLDQILKNR